MYDGGAVLEVGSYLSIEKLARGGKLQHRNRGSRFSMSIDYLFNEVNKCLYRINKNEVVGQSPLPD